MPTNVPDFVTTYLEREGTAGFIEKLYRLFRVNAMAMRRSAIVFALSAVSAAPALAQFAYECFPVSGRSYISKTKCPEGMSWRKVQTDPYYVDRSATQQSGSGVVAASKPKSYGEMTYSELMNEYSRAMNSGDYNTVLALKPMIRHAQRMQEIAAGGTPAPDFPQRAVNCMPNGFGGMRCQ
jgi:hypothetical protein